MLKEEQLCPVLKGALITVSRKRSPRDILLTKNGGRCSTYLSLYNNFPYMTSNEESEKKAACLTLENSFP